MIKRRFGRVRQLPSGRWQARYHGPDRIDRPAPRTFASKGEAERWLTLIEAEIALGEWIDPDAGKIKFAEYAYAWVEERPHLRLRTVQLYEGLLRLHLLPSFADKAIADIKEPHVRRWRKTLLDSGTGPVTVAKAYRLLKAIMNTAVEDGLIRKNPCRIKGAGQEASPERPVLTVEQVFRLARSIDERYRALVLLATFGNLRWGELTALRRRDLDLETGTVRVERTLTQAQDGSLTFGPPKSSAGRRIIAIPDVIVPDLAWHLQHIAQQEEDGLVFLGPKGAMLRRSNFARTWRKAIESAGLPDVHFHDLRHTGTR